MANETRISIIIDADGKAAIENINKVTDATKKIASETGGIVSKIKSHWLGISASIVAAYATINKAWNLAEQAARYEQSKNAFRSMVQSMGMNADIEFEKIRKASGNLIDIKNLTESANKAISLGIPVEKLGELMEISRAKARDMGITTTQAFNDIATGIGRGSPLILDNLGLMLKLGSANEKMAAQLGKTVEQLTDKEKKMAILNATIEAGKEALDRHNLAQLTTYERMQKITATVENMKLHFGALIIRIGVGAIGLAEGIKSAFLMVAEAIVLPFALIEKGLNKLGIAGTFWNDILKEQNRLLQESKTNMLDNFITMIAKSEELNIAMRKTSEIEPLAKIKDKDALWLMEEDMKMMKAREDAWFKEIAERIKYDEYMRRQAEEQIKIEEERHRQILENIQEERDMKIQSYEATWAKYFEMVNQVGGEMGVGLGMMGAGLKGITDIYAGTDPYTEEYNRIAEHYAALIQLKIDRYGAEANIEAEWQSIMVAQEQMTAQQRIATYQNMAGMMAGTMYSMYVAAGSHNKAMFTMYKAFAITEAIISTYAGAARALKDYKFPFSLAVAAIVTAAGMARVAAIAAQKPTGVATAAAPSGAGGYAYTQPMTPEWEKTEEKKQSRTITINIHGNIVDHAAFVRELAPYINEAQGDNVLVLE